MNYLSLGLLVVAVLLLTGHFSEIKNNKNNG